MYKYGGTKRRYRRRHGGVGFSTMNAKESDEYVSELSKKKNKEELERLSDAMQSGNPYTYKVYEGEGTGTRTPSPMPAAQRVITERARTNSEKGGRRREERAARRRTRKHKKHGRKTRHRR